MGGWRVIPIVSQLHYNERPVGEFFICGKVEGYMGNDFTIIPLLSVTVLLASKASRQLVFEYQEQVVSQHCFFEGGRRCHAKNGPLA